MKKPKLLREIEDFTAGGTVTGLTYNVICTAEEKAEFDAYAKENFFVNANADVAFDRVSFKGNTFNFVVTPNKRFILLEEVSREMKVEGSLMGPENG